MQARAVLGAMAAFAALTAPASAQEQDADELARQLSNPVAYLISVPIQANFDFGAGLDNEGTVIIVNVPPVVPISVSPNWNVISRTILPIAYRDNLPTPDDDTFGIGDITQSLFFAPKHSDPIWGVGPVLLIPTASDDVLGAGQWGAGPTAVVLKQSGREDVSSTFLQPFVTRALGQGRSLTLNTESSYDWVGEQWIVPVNVSYSQVFKAGDQIMSFVLGGRYYVDGPEGAPQCGLRAGLTFLFPKG